MTFKNLLFIFFITCSLPFPTEAKVKQTKLKLKSAAQIKIPKSIKTDTYYFKKSDVHKFDDVSYGSMVSYSDKKLPLMVVSYYIYPMDDKNVPAEYLMSYQYESLKSEMEEVHKYKGNTAVLLTETIQQVGNRETFYNKHNIVGDSGDLISETYLTHDQFHYLKLRISFPTYEASRYKSISIDLADQLIANTLVKEKKGTSFKFNLNGSVDEDKAQIIFIMQLAYLSQLEKAFESNDMILDFNQILTAMDLIAKVSEKTFSNEINESNMLNFHEIKQAGYLREFIWTYMNHPNWPLQEDLDLVGFENWFSSHKDKVNPISSQFGRLSIYFD
ncbi:MAG: hypothetical protein ACSHWU_03505 [Marinicella sp.]